MRHITGQNLEATLASEDRESILREELDTLRSQVDELTEEVICFARILFAGDNMFV